MSLKDRLESIVTLVNDRGYLSVGELSQACRVSEMTVRRDLDRLEKENRLRRTFGGAVPAASPQATAADDLPAAAPADTALGERVDVLVTTSVNPSYDTRLLGGLARKHKPIIAESLTVHSEETIVAVDNYQAALDVGREAGRYALRNWGGRAAALDLTYSLSNTQARSRGFTAGLREVVPDAEIVLSINAQSRYATAYQLTRDALTVHRNINLIFAINDTTAWAALRACQDLAIDPEKILIIPFGLEGDTLKTALIQGGYCRLGVAMFPEIVGPVCMEAAIAAHNRVPLPRELVTPYAVLTPQTLPEYYRRGESGWEIRWETASARFRIPLEINPARPRPREELPHRIGFIIPFSEHEWYRKLFTSMHDYASRLGIDFEVIDAEQNLKDEVEMRRRAIARTAAEQVKSGDAVLIDGGPLANYLAEALASRSGITVITDSMQVFHLLEANEQMVLILTGGAYRHSSQMLVGPTAEGALRELRGDKLFLMVAGVSLSNGLWHTNI
ncbi:MAG TPA: DeoR family transcriptional regulator, partial [Anaerolineaceae bacterium]